MRVHFIHGFNVTDGGEGTLGNLMDSLTLQGYDCILHDIGFINLISLRCKNSEISKNLAKQVKKGDIIVGHSNGCLIAHMTTMILANKGIYPRAVVTINAAMRRDTHWLKDFYILNLHSSKDWIVQLGRIWGRLMSLGGLAPHGWGAAGRYGFTSGHPKLTNWDTAMGYWDKPTKGHSDLLKIPKSNYWGGLIGEYLNAIPD